MQNSKPLFSWKNMEKPHFDFSVLSVCLSLMFGGMLCRNIKLVQIPLTPCTAFSQCMHCACCDSSTQYKYGGKMQSDFDWEHLQRSFLAFMCFGLTNMEFNCGTLSSSLHQVVLLCYLFSTSSILGVSPYCSGELPGMHVVSLPLLCMYMVIMETCIHYKY